MSFGGKNVKGGREKEENVKKKGILGKLKLKGRNKCKRGKISLKRVHED
jgi:hypothetical protein